MDPPPPTTVGDAHLLHIDTDQVGGDFPVRVTGSTSASPAAGRQWSARLLAPNLCRPRRLDVVEALPVADFVLLNFLL